MCRNEYFLQVNDDVEILCNGWLGKFIVKLREHYNLGVVGPIDPNRNLMTQAFVHRTHFEIFEPMYPVVFKNWYMDDWLQLVYGLLSIPIENCFFRNSPHKPRYEIQTEAYKHLQDELFNGCIAIQFYLQSKNYLNVDEFVCTSVYPSPPEPVKSVKLNPKQYVLTEKLSPVKDRSNPLNSKLLNVADKNNIVVITFTNLGFIDMTRNWFLNIKYLGIKNYLIICLDEESRDILSSLTSNLFFDPAFSTNSGATNYLEGHYRELVNLKTAYNYRILSLGFNTLLCDNDIVLFKVCI